MLKKILAISGKSGLYRLLSSGAGRTFVVESLADGKRMPILPRDRPILLSDISMFTTGEDILLSEVLTKVYEHEQGQAIDLSALTAKEGLQDRFALILPDYDRDRVYPSDIKKLFSWYNILLAAGFTSFVEEVEEEQEA